MEISTENNFVFPIYSENEFCGNGFIIRNGYALTAAHVLRNGGYFAGINDIRHRFEIIKDFSGKYTEELLNDFALIYCNAFSPNVLPGIAEEDLSFGEQLRVLAYTSGDGDRSIFLDSYQGLYQDLQANYRTENSYKRYGNTKSIRYLSDKEAKVPVKGNSGAPVLNMQTEIVGLFIGMNCDREKQARNGNTVYKNEGYFIEIRFVTKKLIDFIS